jgi:hypothetical protein
MRFSGVIARVEALALAVLLAAAGSSGSRARASAVCVGDCADSGYVTVVNIVIGVNIALGATPLSNCPAFDNGSGKVTIDVLVTAVGNALRGCPPQPTATDAPTSPTPTGDAALDAIAAAFSGLCEEPAQSNYALATDYGYYAFCSTNGGQSTTLRIERFEDSAAAAAGFAAAGRVGPPYDFEDLPATYWERGFARPPDGGSRTIAWQLGCWVVTVNSFDENGGRLAVAPPAASAAIFAAAAELLVDQCPTEQPAPTPSPTKGLGPDLVVASAGAHAHNSTCQPYASLSACVANAGRTAAGAFTVAVEPSGDRLAMSALASGEEQCSSMVFPRPQSQPVTVTADVDDAVDEVDENNNALSKTIPYPSVEATCVPTRLPTATRSLGDG